MGLVHRWMNGEKPAPLVGPAPQNPVLPCQIQSLQCPLQLAWDSAARSFISQALGHCHKNNARMLPTVLLGLQLHCSSLVVWLERAAALWLLPMMAAKSPDKSNSAGATANHGKKPDTAACSHCGSSHMPIKELHAESPVIPWEEICHCRNKLWCQASSHATAGPPTSQVLPRHLAAPAGPHHSQSG